mmetsp:Transcript_12648/g.30066  ORF Transcript_12648/g.30066 Transcript_12648/m.30066 type:complete len:373 (-) Transcript_12648:301-1419(-)
MAVEEAKAGGCSASKTASTLQFLMRFWKVGKSLSASGVAKARVCSTSKGGSTSASAMPLDGAKYKRQTASSTSSRARPMAAKSIRTKLPRCKRLTAALLLASSPIRSLAQESHVSRDRRLLVSSCWRAKRSSMAATLSRTSAWHLSVCGPPSTPAVCTSKVQRRRRAGLGAGSWQRLSTSPGVDKSCTNSSWRPRREASTVPSDTDSMPQHMSRTMFTACKGSFSQSGGNTCTMSVLRSSWATTGPDVVPSGLYSGPGENKTCCKACRSFVASACLLQSSNAAKSFSSSARTPFCVTSLGASSSTRRIRKMLQPSACTPENRTSSAMAESLSASWSLLKKRANSRSMGTSAWKTNLAFCGGGSTPLTLLISA